MNNHGGSRPNSGRKKKFKETTKVVSFRVPQSLEKEIKDAVNQILSKHHSPERPLISSLGTS